MKTIEQRIEEVFTRYNSTLELLNDFSNKESNPNEFILLTCARIDALSNLAYNNSSLKKNFIDFIQKHSGQKTILNEISIPDLFGYLIYQSWVLPGTMKKKGRIHVFDPKRDANFIQFVWDSGIPITKKKVNNLLHFLIDILKKHYRVVPAQKGNKKSTDTLTNLINCIKSEADKSTKFIRGCNLENSALKSMIKEFSISSLLYTEYRCGIIHEFASNLEKQEFYKEKSIFWTTVYNDFFSPSEVLKLHFSASFLLSVLLNCIDSYKTQLIKTQKIPIEIYSDICDFENEFKYLDYESVKEGKDLNISRI